MELAARIAELQAISKRNMAGCHPVLQDRVLKIVEVGAYAGLYFAVLMGGRSWDTQNALYTQGRANLDTVNALRAKAHMSPITLSENMKTVTNAGAGSSWHNFFLAVDLVEDGDPNMAGIQWSWKNNADYLKLGTIVKNCGLEWGGFWKSFKDYPHAQLTGGLSIGEAKGIYLNYNQDYRHVWYEINKRMGLES